MVTSPLPETCHANDGRAWRFWLGCWFLIALLILVDHVGDLARYFGR